MDDSASVTTSSLAVAENKPRRTGGCVGIFFHLFDWNRRFSKKKLFSKRLLPPVNRAKEASKKFGGDENIPKLRLIADENRGSFPNKNNNGVSISDNPSLKNGVQTPSLVVRLMGLESMPSVQNNKLLKDFSSESRGGRRQKLAGENDKFDKKLKTHDFRPQKFQKTAVVDRRSVSRLGAEALQLKNVLSRSRKHHHPKLASPVQNINHQSKRNSSRLIGAATRVLESGLQARNKSKHAISYRARNPMKGGNLESLSQQPSCKNCGNLIDVSESNSKRDVNPSVLKSSYDQENVLKPQDFASSMTNNGRLDDVHVSFQSKVSSSPITGETKDFVALNRTLTGQTRSKVPAKVEDVKFDKRFKFENGPSHWQKRGLTRNRPTMVSNAPSAGKQMGSEACKAQYQGQTGKKNSNEIRFRFNSEMKNRCEMTTRLHRRRNNQNAACKTTSIKRSSSKPSDEKICLQKPFPLTGDSLGALVEEKLRELTSRVGYDSRINGNPSQRRSATVFQDLVCALSTEKRITQNDMEVCPKRKHLHHHSRCRNDHNTKLCLQNQARLQKALGSTGRKNSDHLSPGSVLEGSFSNESCWSSSLEDCSARAQHAVSTTCSYEESQFQECETNPFYSDVFFIKENTRNELVVNLLAYISQVLSTIGVVHSRIKGHMRAHIKHVIFYSELVLSNQTTHDPNELNHFFICDLLLELDTIADVIWTTFGNFLGYQNSGYQLKRFVFDAVIEYLESKYIGYSICGFRGWITLPWFTGFDGLVQGVVEEVGRWMDSVGETSDELVERDMSHCVGKWTDFEVEVYETGASIGSDILQMLVDEIVFDI